MVFNLLDGTVMTRLLQQTRSLYSTTVQHSDLKPVGVTVHSMQRNPSGCTVLWCNANIGRNVESCKQYLESMQLLMQYSISERTSAISTDV